METATCTGTVTNLFPSSFSPTHCNVLELSSHNTIPARFVLVCACLHPENTCRAPHQQSKRPEATRWVHCPVPSLQQQCHVVLLHLGTWFQQCYLDKNRVRHGQRWGQSYRGVMISHYWSWNACLSSMISKRRLKHIFQLLPQPRVLPPLRTSNEK